MISSLFLAAMAALSSQGESNPDTDDPIVWLSVSANNEPYFIRQIEMEYFDAPRTGFRAWVHSDHSKNAKVAFRTSVWLVEFDCRGGFTLKAYTAYKADGSVHSERNGSGSYTYIRPNTLYAEAQEKLCRD